jgi:Tfp pilus assembly protein PilV
LSNRCKIGEKCGAGFTLLEALVALALIVAFVATLWPYLFYAHRLMDNSERRVAAQILLRTLLDAPFDRSRLADAAARDGKLNDLHWHIIVAPIAIELLRSHTRQSWTAYRIVASVSAGGGQIVSAETVRLAKPE